MAKAYAWISVAALMPIVILISSAPLLYYGYNWLEYTEPYWT
ncbi:hypothetical protein [Ponticaulis koreensis]|nr:hypothetical protein [Ponticaulis koreensis]